MRHVILASDLGGDLPKESTLYETFNFNIEDKSRYGALDTIVDSCLLICLDIQKLDFSGEFFERT